MRISAAQDKQVRAALNELLGWSEIARSPQLSGFLTYIVEARLRGEESAIKAYSIAVDVFGRPPTFDPQSDPIVRVQARRLRGLLEQYYSEHGNDLPVRIRLPVGRYVPKFEFAAGEEGAPADVARGHVARARRTGPSQAPTWRWVGYWALAFGLVVIGLLLVDWSGTSQPPLNASAAPAEPRVSVQELGTIGDTAGTQPLGAGLAIELVTDLRLFEDVEVVYAGLGDDARTDGISAGPLDYRLWGAARKLDGEVQFSATLSRANSDVPLWTHTIAVPLDPGGQPLRSIDDISRHFATILGNHRGPLHSDGRYWIDSQADLTGFTTPYVCWMVFLRYHDTGMGLDAERAQACVAALRGTSPGSAFALAATGALMMEQAAGEPSDSGPDPAISAEAERLVDRGIAVAPLSSFVWEQKGRVLALAGKIEAAQAAFTSALQLNPANAEAIAAYGRMLVFRGPSARGLAFALTALNTAPSPPPWYYAAPALDALRSGDDRRAIEYAERLIRGDSELGSVIALAAAIRTGDVYAIDRYRPVMLESGRFRQHGVLPVLRHRIADAALVEMIARTLSEGGIAPNALNGPF